MTGGSDGPLPDGLEDALPLHVLAYYWEKFEPRLDCYDTVDHEVVRVGLDSGDFVVGGRKVCVGRFKEGCYHKDRFERGSYLECPTSAPVTEFSQCDKCAGEVFIMDQECVFDPKCDGESCPKDDGRPSEFCRRRHILYLAFYGTMAKVGMSSEARVGSRLVEQGADAYSVIATFPNRRKAREEEVRVSDGLGIPQWFKQQTILSNFCNPVDKAGIGEEYDRLKAVLEQREGFSVRPLNHLDGYGLELPLPSAPRLQQTPGMHFGRMVGVKGKWLVYRSDGLKALNLSDLPARYIADEYLVESLKTNK